MWCNIYNWSATCKIKLDPSPHVLFPHSGCYNTIQYSSIARLSFPGNSTKCLRHQIRWLVCWQVLLYPGGHSNITVYTCVTKKNAWKGYFFHRKARNAHDTLRVSKTVFLEEKGTFEICLSHKKGTFSPNIFFPIYRWVLSMHNLIRVCKVFNKNLQRVLFQQKLVRVTFSSMWTCLGFDFHRGVKTHSGGKGVLEKFLSRMCKLLYLSGPPGGIRIRTFFVKNGGMRLRGCTNF